MANIESVRLPNGTTYDINDANAVQVADIINNLTSTSTTAPLSANMGRVLNEQSAALTNVYGAKNLIDGENAATFNASNTNGTITNTVADPKNYIDFYIDAFDGLTYLGALVMVHISTPGSYSYNVTVPNGTNRISIKHNSSIDDIGASYSFAGSGAYILSLTILGADPSTIGGFSFTDVMLRDARITDDTFVPYAKTNKQLTEDKAEKSDISSISVTGTTNTSGTQIDAGTIFYLNGALCKALANIAVNAAFTLNTNYKSVTVNEELAHLNSTSRGINVYITSYTSSDSPYTFPADGYVTINSVALTTGTIRLLVLDSSGQTIAAEYMNITSANEARSIYVRKGTKAYLATISAGAAAEFKGFA